MIKIAPRKAILKLLPSEHKAYPRKLFKHVDSPHFKVLPGIYSTDGLGKPDSKYVKFKEHIIKGMSDSFKGQANNISENKFKCIPGTHWRDAGYLKAETYSEAKNNSKSTDRLKAIYKEMLLNVFHFIDVPQIDYHHKSGGSSSAPFWFTSHDGKKKWSEFILSRNNKSVSILNSSKIASASDLVRNGNVFSAMSRAQPQDIEKTRSINDIHGDPFDAVTKKFDNKDIGTMRWRIVMAGPSSSNWPGMYWVNPIMSAFLSEYSSTFKCTTPSRIVEQFKSYPHILGVDIANFDWQYKPEHHEILLSVIGDVAPEMYYYIKNHWNSPFLSKSTSMGSSVARLVTTNQSDIDNGKNYWYGLPSGDFLTVLVGRSLGCARQIEALEQAFGISPFTPEDIRNLLLGKNNRFMIANSTDDTLFGFTNDEDKQTMSRYLSGSLNKASSHTLEEEELINFLGMTAYTENGKIVSYKSVHGYMNNIVTPERTFGSVKKFPHLGFMTRYNEDYLPNLPEGWATEGFNLIDKAYRDVYDIKDFEKHFINKSKLEATSLSSVMSGDIARYLLKPGSYHYVDSVKTAVDSLTDQEHLDYFGSKKLTVSKDLIDEGLANHFNRRKI